MASTRMASTRNPIVVEPLGGTPVAAQRVEIVERKGVGHPDTICDAVAERVSVELCRAYLDAVGRVLHHNADKGFLIAGRTLPRLGGGEVLEPMRLLVGDRATTDVGGRHFDVAAIATAAARGWIGAHLRYVDPERHFVVESTLKPGSVELTDLFGRETIGANDTSAAMGYAPLSETERLVIAAERYLNGSTFQAAFPEAGQDIKVMACRTDATLGLTVALAFVDRFVQSAAAYFERKEAIRRDLQAHLSAQLEHLDAVTVDLNTLDDPTRGEGGMYLTVLGTSAEGGDCGQVGRGNRVNGVIPLNRPIGSEAAAGKNPVRHVGKIYTLLTHHIADRIQREVPGIDEVYVWLCSQIGRPIDDPWLASAQVRPAAGADVRELSPAVEQVFARELAAIGGFTERLTRGELPVW